jgi:ABC-type transport system involved in multi-copper enzyme maturation permease subunit
MIRSLRAELLKLRRRSLVIAAGFAAIVYATITTLVTFLTASREPRGIGARGFNATFQSLARPEGAFQGFADGIGFVGVILLAIFVSIVGLEYARGTFATSLMKQPRRLQLLGGKLAALLLFVAMTLAVAEAAAWLLALGIAPIRGISTSAWFSISALEKAAAAYGTALFVAGAWACIGMAVATFTRSVPIGLAIAVGWAGPIEHITQQAWAEASRWFPGLLLEAFAAGGNAQVSLGRAFVTVATFVVVLITVALVVFNRRDVTA